MPDQILYGQIPPKLSVWDDLVSRLKSTMFDDPQHRMDVNDRQLAGADPMEVAANVASAPLGRSAAEISKGLDQIINAKDVVYHNTSPENVKAILESGQIDPSSGMNRGVSVSRVPRISSSNRGATLVIDKTALPQGTVPVAENSFKKTKPPSGLWNYMTEDEKNAHNLASLKGDYTTTKQIAKDVSNRIGTRMNPNFEYELRTPNQPIPASAIRNIIVDPDRMVEGLKAPGWGDDPESIGRAADALHAILGGKSIGLDELPRRALAYSRAAEAAPKIKDLLAPTSQGNNIVNLFAQLLK